MVIPGNKSLQYHPIQPQYLGLNLVFFDFRLSKLKKNLNMNKIKLNLVRHLLYRLCTWGFDVPFK